MFKDLADAIRGVIFGNVVCGQAYVGHNRRCVERFVFGGIGVGCLNVGDVYAVVRCVGVGGG